MPKLKISIDGVKMVHDLSDFYRDGYYSGTCLINFPISLLNKTGPFAHPNDDIITIGTDYFKSFQALEINYEAGKIAFVGGKAGSSEAAPGSGNTALIIILIIVGLAVVGGAIFYFLKKRNERLQGSLQSYDRLS